MPNLAGLHDREAQAIAVPGTWIVDTVALSENPQPANYDIKFHWIVRLNWGYGSAGTLPAPDGYADFARRIANYVAQSKGCTRWIIGNEPNLPREWPDGQPILPHQYAACYKMCRDAIHALPGHELDDVLVAASGPWNNELKYPGNSNGDWIINFADTIAEIEDIDGHTPDGFSLHAYTHGYNVSLVTSSARMQAPFQSRHYEFRTYRDYLEAIPDELSHLPSYITEANGDGPWQAVGLMPAMLGEIDAWNKQSKQKVRCVAFYRYPKYDAYYIAGKGDVEAEYKAAVARGYSSPGGSEQVTEQQFIPAVSTGTTPQPTLPPRQIDQRLIDRGVTVETPPLAPGDKFWRVVKARWYDEQEAGGRHHIYIEAPDGTPFMVTWPSGTVRGIANGRGGFDAGNFPMSKSLNEFWLSINDGTPSENVKGIGMGANGNPAIHTSTGVTFELATMPQVGTPPTPTLEPYFPTDAEKIGPLAGIVTATVLNVRSGPGVNYPVLRELRQGDSVVLSAKTNKGQGDWYRISNAGGWASADYVRLDDDEPTPAPSEPVDNWTRSIAFVRAWEGDWADDPNDPGGATNKGITLGTYTRWRKVQGQPEPTKDDLRNLSDAEANTIYREWYWRESGADQLSWPLALAHFDTAVNAGVGKAQEMLQRSNGSFLAYMGHLIDWYTRIDGFQHFGRAWMRRRADLLLEASKP